MLPLLEPVVPTKLTGVCLHLHMEVFVDFISYLIWVNWFHDLREKRFWQRWLKPGKQHLILNFPNLICRNDIISIGILISELSRRNQWVNDNPLKLERLCDSLIWCCKYNLSHLSFSTIELRKEWGTKGMGFEVAIGEKRKSRSKFTTRMSLSMTWFLLTQSFTRMAIYYFC